MINSVPGLYIYSSIEDEDLAYDLSDLGALAVETRDASTMSLPDFTGVMYIAGFETENQRQAAELFFQKQNKDLKIVNADIKDDGWSHKWKDFFAAVVNKYTQIVTPWMEVPENKKLTLVIDPGMAFGTGGHETTRILIQMIEAFYENNQMPTRALDVGCGSGVLSLVSAGLGCKEVTAFDIDPLCITATNENADKNGFFDAIKAFCATPSEVTGQWPLVIANIQLSVFQTESVSIKNFVEPGGMLLISGILEEQEQECIRLFSDFYSQEIKKENGWIAISFKKQ